MAARLILNADDFGLTRGINRAIAELHTAGVLTSATLMANGPAFGDAVTIAHAHPTLGIGCHIVLTDGIPVSDPAALPTLCPNRRTFRDSLIGFVRDLLLGRIDTAEIEREALAQVQKLQRAGIDVTHLDSHKHTHLFPVVAAQLAHIVSLTSMGLRKPFEPRRTHEHATLKRRLQLSALGLFQPGWHRAIGLSRTTDGTFGIAATGNLNATTLAEILHSIPATGTYELLCHPGYNDADMDSMNTRLRTHREIEYQALLTELPKIFSHPNAPYLIKYSDL